MYINYCFSEIVHSFLFLPLVYKSELHFFRIYSTRFSDKNPCSQQNQGTSLVVQWLRPHTPNAGDLGSIPGQGTRSHMLQLKILHTAINNEYPACCIPVNCTTHSPLLLSWWQLHPSRYPGQTLSVLHGSFPLIAVSKLSGNPLGSTFQIPPEPDHLPGPWLLPVRASIILGDSKGSQLVSPLLPSASYNPFSAEQPE